ncbi:MAG: wax ester/triacylglycerol synthase domain-containing protein, partial [Mycobacterium sp.]
YIKSHQALINGMTALEIGHVIADRSPRPVEVGEDIWLPAREPSDGRLVVDAVGDWLARPGQELRALRSTVADVATNTGELAQLARRAAHMARRVARRSAPDSPLNTTVSRHRRFTVASAPLADFRRIRARYDCDVNDVVLSVIAGALRNWLLSRGEPVTASMTVRAMAPTSVYPDAHLQSAGPGQAIDEVAPFLIDHPVGEGNPLVRLSQIAHETETHSAVASLVDARTIVTLSGFPPPTLHAMGTRVATQYPPRQFNLLITNVPGPQSQMYIAGAKLLETYAVPPLLHDQVLAIGVTSYCGMVYFGINADRDAMSDVDVFPELLGESLEEFIEAAQ